MKNGFILLVAFVATIFSSESFASIQESKKDKILEVLVEGREGRSQLADLGYALEDVREDRAFIYGNKLDAKTLESFGFQVKVNEPPLQTQSWWSRARFRNYFDVKRKMQSLAKHSSGVAALVSLGESTQGRDVPMLRISSVNEEDAVKTNLPLAFYVGCHHAREHLSVEIPLDFAEYLVTNYGKDENVTRLVDTREIYIAPMINPDGHMYDYTDGRRGRMWRKNRFDNGDGSFGVDLNRNYGFMWGTGGSSSSTRSDTYMGTKPFSEVETQNIKNFVEDPRNLSRMNILISFHTFSELILYPWGHTYDSIEEKRDLAVFEKMAQTMSGWNNYTPQQSSDLYIASGDTTDWA